MDSPSVKIRYFRISSTLSNGQRHPAARDSAPVPRRAAAALSPGHTDLPGHRYRPCSPCGLPSLSGGDMFNQLHLPNSFLCHSKLHLCRHALQGAEIHLPRRSGGQPVHKMIRVRHSVSVQFLFTELPKQLLKTASIC